MLDKPISPLHQRMIDDMTARRFSEATRRDYARHVRNFEAFLCRSPETATCEDLRRYQLHVAEQKIGAATVNSAVSALRFFFNVTLERPELVRHLTTVQRPRKAPVVLNQEEVVRFLEAAPGLKYKAVFGVAYGAGLRVSEVADLKVSDIDSKRMTLRVEQGKGRRDRYVMLSPQLLERLREWWHAARPQAWLFPGQDRDCPEFRVWFGHNGKRGAIPWPDARNPRSRMLFLISFLVALIPRRPLIRTAFWTI